MFQAFDGKISDRDPSFTLTLQREYGIDDRLLYRRPFHAPGLGRGGLHDGPGSPRDPFLEGRGGGNFGMRRGPTFDRSFSSPHIRPGNFGSMQVIIELRFIQADQKL